MQQISAILTADLAGAKFTDEYGTAVNKALELVIGTAAEITFDLRGGKTSPETGELLPLDSGIFSNCRSYFFAVDRDFKRTTAPLLLKTSGIEAVVSENGTFLKVVINNTAVEALLDALGESKSAEFNCELAGLDEYGIANFSWLFPITLRNRIFMGSNEVPETVTADPAYLNSAEVKALIAGEAVLAAQNALPGIGENKNWFINGKDTGISAQGIPGPQGDKGDRGEQGPPGESGPRGERGAAFTIDATGLLADRSLYDAEAKDFSYLATDNGNVYIKASDTSGDWSDPIPFKGDKGDKGEKGEPGEPGKDGADGVLEENYIDIDSVTDGYLVLDDETIPVSVEIEGKVYPVLGMERSGTNFKIPVSPILAAANLAEYVGIWRVWRAGGKPGDRGPQGVPGNVAFDDLTAEQLAMLTPQKGVDYWTEEDREEIMNDFVVYLETEKW